MWGGRTQHHGAVDVKITDENSKPENMDYEDLQQ